VRPFSDTYILVNITEGEELIHLTQSIPLNHCEEEYHLGLRNISYQIAPTAEEGDVVNPGTLLRLECDEIWPNYISPNGESKVLATWFHEMPCTGGGEWARHTHVVGRGGEEKGLEPFNFTPLITTLNILKNLHLRLARSGHEGRSIYPLSSNEADYKKEFRAYCEIILRAYHK